MEKKIQDDKTFLSLHPDHLKDLRKSGLSNEIIHEAGIYSVPPRDFKKVLGPGLVIKVTSLLALPYPNCDGFIQWKLFPSIKNKDGHTIRYFQPLGSSNYLYIPEQVILILPDVSIPIYITEGVKKALKACQESLFCIALIGLHNWSDGSPDRNLIPDFDKIALRGREVFIVPDNDWLIPDRHGERKNLREAVHGLAYRLIDRGAKPSIVQLPEGPLKGIDDYLCKRSIDEFKKLPRSEVRKQTIDEMIEGAHRDDLRDIFKRMAPLMESEKEIYIGMLSKKLKINKSILKGDIRKIEGKGIGKDEKIEKLLNSESQKQTQFSAIEFIGDQLFYGGIWNGEKILLRSDGEIILSNSTDSFRFIRSKLTSSVGRRYKSGDSVNGNDLLGHLTRLFSSHIIFRDQRFPLLISIWVMGTYLFKIFQFYGYIVLTSPVIRCGKSRVLEILSCVCFNATPLTAIPSEASIYRETDLNAATQIFDEVESLREKDKEKHGEIFALLHVGFKKGSVVPRIEKRGDEQVPAYYSAYSPKTLARIKKMSDSIEDRSFRISMPRKLKTEKVKRLNLRKQMDEFKILVEDLYLWALQNAEDVARVYEEADRFEGMEAFDDRYRDIWEPLLSIAHIINAESGDESLKTYNQLLDLALDMSRDRLEREQINDTIPVLLEVIKNLLDGETERFVSSSDLFDRIKTDESESLKFIHSKRGLGTFLATYELHSTFQWQNEKSVRGYVFTQKWVEETKKRFG